MAWSMPTTGQWNPGIAMTQDMNMGTYTPEQWAVLQQQNWQQWAQWQQQYAQWQTQYGDNYTQQMQTMQSMAGPPPIPPPSSAAPPPAPPPEKPPPPPHENDLPLYGNCQKSNTTISTAVQSQSNSQAVNSINAPTGNNQNWSYSAEPISDTQQLQSVNSEDLKKLAEEERMFDIQFKNWEEEIEKWKKENVNHPDKQAYKEYEQKFETCRVQLLERRQQMKLKRARLLSNTSQASNTTTTGNINTSIPPPLQNTNMNNYSQNVHQNKQVQNNFPALNSQKNQNIQQYPQQNTAQQGYNRNSIKTLTPQDKYETYPPVKDIYKPIQPTNPNFLPSSQSKEIPGLDLVPETDRSTSTMQNIVQQDVIDITQDQNSDQSHQQQKSRGPDYSKISKGINNILGDEKIMNILSMVSNVMPPRCNDITQKASGHYGPVGSKDTVPNVVGQYRPYGGNDAAQNAVGHYRPPGGHDAVQNMSGHYQTHQSGNHATQDAGGQYRQNENQWDRNNSNYQNTDYDNRQQVPFKQNIVHNFSESQGQLNTSYPKVPYQRYEDNYTREDFEQNDVADKQYYGGGGDHSKKIPMRSGLPPFKTPNLPPQRPRPQSPNTPSYEDSSEYSFGGYEGRALPNAISKPLIQPPIPKWVDEPLFTPSIIVDYEHKPLRLKARGFIEPVHMFDYNHKSKDGDSSHKKDFEREIDDLFTRKPRKADVTDPWNFSNDYERRPVRDDQRDRTKQSIRDDHDIYNRRPDNVYEERRRDDRDRFGRDDYERRDRGADYDHSRDSGRERDFGRDRDLGRDRDYGRDRDLGRGWGRDRDPIRERDLIRDRDLVRDREPIRDRDAGRDREFGRDRDVVRDRDTGRDRESARDRIGKERDRDTGREKDTGRYRDYRKDDTRTRSRSRDKDSRKREHSKDNDSISSSGSKKIKESKEDSKATNQPAKPQHVVMIDDLLEPPGRDMRPAKLVIILRGIPGSGKSYLAKLIRDKEAEHGGTVRIMSIDDYFMQEGEIEEEDPNTGKIVKKPLLKYEYDEKSEETYLTSLKRAFKRSVTDGYFTFLIFDAVNEQLKSYADIWNFSRQSGFQVYICTMELDTQTCFKRNIHMRSLEDIEVIASRFFPTPPHHIQLDATTLLQSASITDVQMEDAEDVTMEDTDNTEVDSSFTSKWEKMDDAVQLARLDGTNKPLRPSQLSMEDYLQLDDWTPSIAKPGKKTVRWADIEERREQEKMRAIGFVVGQTDWNRMTDPTMGSSALTQTKYIERVRRF